MSSNVDTCIKYKMYLWSANSVPSYINNEVNVHSVNSSIWTSAASMESFINNSDTELLWLTFWIHFPAHPSPFIIQANHKAQVRSGQKLMNMTAGSPEAGTAGSVFSSMNHLGKSEHRTRSELLGAGKVATPEHECLIMETWKPDCIKWVYPLLLLKGDLFLFVSLNLFF